MNEGAEGVAFFLELAAHLFAAAIVAQAEGDDARRLVLQPRAPAEHRQAEHHRPRGHAIVDEAIDAEAEREHGLGDDPAVAAGAEDENGRGRHASQYMEGVTRDQQLRIKRLFDVVASAAGLALTGPAMAAAAAAVRVTMGAPVFFRQERPGLHGRPFHIYKFRTMTDERGPDGQLLPDEQRLTAVGRFIRSTSLDELPQLLNVLKGEMSIVGPRPLLMRYLPRYNARQAKRHEMKPGITGLTAVRGRNALSWAEKFEFDVQYVERWSLALDARILGETVFKVLRRRGVTSAGHATMPEFMGNE